MTREVQKVDWKIFQQLLDREAYDLLDWWQKHMIDHEYGGFYGRVDHLSQLYPDAPKGVILNTRILWSFSAAARYYEQVEWIIVAQRALKYLIKHFWDEEKGGVYWMVDVRGKPVETKKQVYAQAFMLYGLSEYYLLTKDAQVLPLAARLFELLETHSWDKRAGGYLEAFDRDWNLLEDLRLSEQDANEAKTMNTHLHILEAYTNYFRIHPSADVKVALKRLLETFSHRFIDTSSGSLHLFFDQDWNLKSDEISFGHDIEASWLMWEAAEILQDEKLLYTLRPIVLKLAAVTHQNAFDTHQAIMNEAHGKKVVDASLHWWPQAEGMVGFLNAFQLDPKPAYSQRVLQLWQYIQFYLKDPVNGEWHWGRTAEGEIMKKDKAGPWKAPYHSVRALMECSRRIHQLN